MRTCLALAVLLSVLSVGCKRVPPEEQVLGTYTGQVNGAPASLQLNKDTSYELKMPEATRGAWAMSDDEITLDRGMSKPIKFKVSGDYKTMTMTEGPGDNPSMQLVLTRSAAPAPAAEGKS